MKKNIGSLALLAALSTCLVFNSCSKSRDQLNDDQIGSVGVGDSTYVIGIRSGSYDKPDLWVGKGIPVTWVNRDNTTHSVTADDGTFTSGPLQPGNSFTRIFSVPGVYKYHDDYSGARGMLSVFGREEPQ